MKALRDGEMPILQGLSDADFARFGALIQDQTGIRLTPSKRAHMEGKLKKRAASLGLANVADYCRMLFERGGLSGELDALIHLATTNKTDFFREKAHFDLLDKTLLPALLNARPRGGTPRIKVWSAAASNGAEAYSAAMVLAEAAKGGAPFEFAVLGTDVSCEMVAEANRAIYPATMIAPVPDAMKMRYFLQQRGAGNLAHVRIVPELRRHVRFQQLNLIAEKLSVDRDVDVYLFAQCADLFRPADAEGGGTPSCWAPAPLRCSDPRPYRGGNRQRHGF